MHRTRFEARRSGPPVVAVLGVATLLVLVAGAAARVRLRHVPAVRAPLAALEVVRGPAHVTAPVALLYIDRACPRCRPAAARFDSLARADRLNAFIVSNDRRDSAGALERYAGQAGVRASGLALDTAHAFAHAERLGAVPVLVLVDAFGGATISYGAPVRLTHTGADP